MFKRTIGFGVAAAAIAGMGAFMTTATPAHADGADLTITNDTGADVDVVIWEGDGTHHHKDAGGIHAGTIKAGAKATAQKVKQCTFHVYLFTKDENVFHKRFTDCKITDIHIAKTDDPHHD